MRRTLRLCRIGVNATSPAYVSHTGRFVSELHRIDEAKVMQQQCDNFFNLFSKIDKGFHVK
jgi:Tat protein secretion system quality control protein TatD with DNase activity